MALSNGLDRGDFEEVGSYLEKFIFGGSAQGCSHVPKGQGVVPARFHDFSGDSISITLWMISHQSSILSESIRRSHVGVGRYLVGCK